MTDRDTYWLGYQHGRSLATHNPLVNHEHTLRLELRFAAGTTRQKTVNARAYALGALRGYRETLND